MEYTKRRNLNRGYMKLEVWQRGLDLFDLSFRLAGKVADFKLKSQFTDAAQSVSANVAEGYGRRSLAEYIYFLYVSKGSLGEALTRAIGLRRAGLLNASEFEQFDTLHYEVENKLLGLIEPLEAKQATGQWTDTLPLHSSHSSPGPSAHPLPHRSAESSYQRPIQPGTRSSPHPQIQSSPRATPRRASVSTSHSTSHPTIQ